jgi:moderate conductance mechanosensitive channel
MWSAHSLPRRQIATSREFVDNWQLKGTEMTELTEFLDQWIVVVRLVAIVLGAILLLLSVKMLSRRLTKTLVKRLKKHQENSVGNGQVANERLMQRTETISLVISNFAGWAIGITAVVMLLAELGVNVGALLGVTAILGAAIGFGAQSLVKDVISGVFIVIEDQYGVGDWVEIGNISGEVEHVGLRVTELRDIHGTLWFVRNGEILHVGNSSQEWAKALLDLAFAYDNDVAACEKVIHEVGAKLREDKKFGPMITSDLDVLGMQHVSGEQFVIRVSVRTAPGNQWAVSRELRGRLKVAFDAAGIGFVQAAKINLAK